MIVQGYKLISIPDGLTYIVPQAGYYYDYLNCKHLYENWTQVHIGKLVEKLNIQERWMDKEGKTRICNVRTLVFSLEKASDFQNKITHLKVEQQ